MAPGDRGDTSARTGRQDPTGWLDAVGPEAEPAASGRAKRGRREVGQDRAGDPFPLGAVAPPAATGHPDTGHPDTGLRNTGRDGDGSETDRPGAGRRGSGRDPGHRGTGQEPVDRESGHSDAEPDSRTSRAGRNLVAAVAVGLGLALAVAASLFFRKEAFVGLTSVAIVLGVWELAGALGEKRITIPVIPLGIGSLGMLVSAFVAGEEGLLVAFSLTAFGALLWRIIDGVTDAVRDVAASVFTAAYVPLLAGFAMLMLAAPDGALRIVVFILAVVASDVGGYTAGVLFGRRPLAPSVSPKKTWEGLAGSALMSMAVSAASVLLLLHGRWWAGVAVGAAAVVTATLGDLSESMLKRDLGVKDMGTLLPGHGGIMDRLDSLLPTAPAAYLLLTLLVPPG